MIYLVDSSFKDSELVLDYDLTFGWSKSLEILGELLESALEETLPKIVVAKFDHSFAPFLEAAAPFLPLTYVRDEDWGAHSCFTIGAKIDQISTVEFKALVANVIEETTPSLNPEDVHHEGSGVKPEGLEGVEDAEQDDN